MGCAPIHVSCCINFCISCFGHWKLSRNPISGSFGDISNFFKAGMPNLIYPKNLVSMWSARVDLLQAQRSGQVGRRGVAEPWIKLARGCPFHQKSTGCPSPGNHRFWPIDSWGWFKHVRRNNKNVMFYVLFGVKPLNHLNVQGQCNHPHPSIPFLEFKTAQKGMLIAGG